MNTDHHTHRHVPTDFVQFERRARDERTRAMRALWTGLRETFRAPRRLPD